MITEQNLLKPTNDISEKLEPLINGQGQNFTSQPGLKSSPKQTESGLPSLTPLYEIWNDASKEIRGRTPVAQNTIGLSSIDEMLWGFRKGILYTIGARTSHGKTSFAINMVRTLAETGKRIIYFTMETSKEQLLEKLYCNFMRVNSLDLLHGKALQEFEAKHKLFDAWIGDIKLLIDDKYGYDFPSMLKVIEIIKPDFVFVDYIQMISTKGYRSKVEAIEEYVRKFAELAVTKKFCAILISQINRSGVDEPTMSKFKWAGVLEEHSRVAVILSYNKLKGSYVVNVEKNSFGQTGECRVKFEPEYSSFRDLTDAEIYSLEEKKQADYKAGGLYK